MQSADNNGKTPYVKLRSNVQLIAYVSKEIVQDCPFCHSKTEIKSYKNRSGKITKAAISTCDNCKKHFVTYKLYREHTDKFVCQNPDEIQRIEDEIAKNKIQLQETENSVRNEKLRIANMIFPSFNDVDPFSAKFLEKSWLKESISLSTLNSLVASYIVKNKGKHNLIFVSLLGRKKIKNKTTAYTIVSADDWLGKKLLASEIAAYDYYYITDNLYEIVDFFVINEASYKSRLNVLSAFGVDYWKPKHSRYRDNDSYQRKPDYSDNDELETVYVYYRLNNSCLRNNHDIEAVTAKTTNVKNNQPVEVNVFYCKRCKKYFINFEALQSYFAKGIYPALQYTFNRIDDGTLRDASELMMYGYNVREGQLSQLERRRILEWIIDYGLLSKAEIIRDLQFKVRYNGRKAGNERAKEKWLDDIQYVSHYIEHNTRSIKATFVFNEHK